MSNSGGRNGGGGGGQEQEQEEQEVDYYDADFNFEEHAASCAVEFERRHYAYANAAAAANRHAAADGPSAEDRPTEGGGASNNPSFPTSSDGPDGGGTSSARQAERWDAFHSTHATGNFFKSRRYILKAFPCLLMDDDPAAAAPEELDESSQQQQRHSNEQQAVMQRRRRRRRRVVLEIGCGSGSTVVPILKHSTPSSTTVVLACDFARSAVEATRQSVEAACGGGGDGGSNDGRGRSADFRAFVCDPTGGADDDGNSLLLASSARAAAEELHVDCDPDDGAGGVADGVLCVFALSAIMPDKVGTFLRQVYQATRPGGLVCFRDYGMYDMPMLRFRPEHRVDCVADCTDATCTDADGAAPRLFMRGDGTLARFFHVETVERVFTHAGFTVEELRYATVYNVNRRTGQKLKRVFVHGLFRRPE